ncbi:MAG: uroporphyrinogen decarboxylase family protein [Clostridiales bacterium]|nr:uroporphyrinogen-III decarboxylase [Eubacteriales bacterium]MDH7566032.1 uroporphyrinogen decarboxylase family protein [Clostridiales bacterium]
MSSSTVQELKKEKYDRFKEALKLEKPDVTPVMLSGEPFFMKYAEPSAKISDLVNRPLWAYEKVIEGIQKLSGVDVYAGLIGSYIQVSGAMFLTKMKLPGRELPEDALFQYDEVGLMTVEDYDTIIDKGWNAFYSDFVVRRLGYKPEEFEKSKELLAAMMPKVEEAGINLLSGAASGMLFDAVCMGRGMSNFMKDLHRMPDKILEVFDAAMAEMTDDLKKQLDEAKPFITAVIPANHASNDFISRKMFEKFAWPMYKTFADIAIDRGSNVYFHMDSRWDDNLDFFLDFPKGRCIFDLDGATDIYKVKKVLGGRMCITGDVSPSSLALGTPEDVYNYSTKLIRDIGPEGFILSSGCSIPPNAKPENVEAMVAAVRG